MGRGARKYRRLEVARWWFYGGVFLLLAGQLCLLRGSLSLGNKGLFLGTIGLDVVAVLFGIGGVRAWKRESKCRMERFRQIHRRMLARHSTQRADWRQSIQELERSNRDLEHFAHTVSHDLQDPLHVIRRSLERFRKLAGYAYPSEHKNVTGGLSSVAKTYESERSQGSSITESKAKELAYLQYVEDSATELAKRIQVLLQQAQPGAEIVQTDKIPTVQILDHVLCELRDRLAERCVSVMRDPLPNVAADPVLFHLLFQNLISNAIRYGGDEPKIWITSIVNGQMPTTIPSAIECVGSVHATKARSGEPAREATPSGVLDWRATILKNVPPSMRATSPIFVVSDRGVGIPWERQISIFDIFDRGTYSSAPTVVFPTADPTALAESVPSTDSVPSVLGLEAAFDSVEDSHSEDLHSRVPSVGYGIGLATCRRIVERHGGLIGVHSEVGVGTTFYFTLH